ncbi:MAG: class I SAM-dependent methyltransferase [Bryobacteraceae bacterium]|nr:class I SAM-dependent methyltransferase [Bryobacteraceae bacterium]
MRQQDIAEIVSAAITYKKLIDTVKKDAQSPDFGWYPYDSFRSLPVLNKMLQGERRDLLALTGPAPMLDIGCGDGDLSFFFESLGSRVVAIDNWNPNFNRARGFTSIHAALDSSVEFHMSDLDTGLNLPGRTFGLALCLGVLYHLKNPFLLLESLARHTRYCALSTRIAQRTPKGVDIADEPVAYLLDPFEANNDASNYWIFSPAGLRRILDRVGWDLCDYTTTGFQSGSTPASNDRDQRAFCMLRSRLPDPWLGVDLDGGWHGLENGSWRWTERMFAVRMQRPQSAAGTPALLRFCFTLPLDILNTTGPLRMNAKVNEHDLPWCEYSSAGEHTYEYEIPFSALSEEQICVRFELDKCWGPTSNDKRELGLQVVFWKYAGAIPEMLNPISLGNRRL